jgi:hypothetical protein
MEAAHVAFWPRCRVRDRGATASRRRRRRFQSARDRVCARRRTAPDRRAEERKRIVLGLEDRGQHSGVRAASIRFRASGSIEPLRRPARGAASASITASTSA